ncbi:unnamed protein product [Microthlaspi erraticum]|uniref:Uncharacterized protein n=1 Tax=Microthlaspi erraticum TaxID=1685480 RepID=A0A6D2JY03_9BRAS|nr:unnamed protein product [Microthlaspi erraticum]
MSCSVRCRLVMVFCFTLLLLSSNVECATARPLGLHNHHHKDASSPPKVVNGGGRRSVLGGVETVEEVVNDYHGPHDKTPIHNPHKS